MYALNLELPHFWRSYFLTQIPLQAKSKIVQHLPQLCANWQISASQKFQCCYFARHRINSEAFWHAYSLNKQQKLFRSAKNVNDTRKRYKIYLGWKFDKHLARLIVFRPMLGRFVNFWPKILFFSKGPKASSFGHFFTSVIWHKQQQRWAPRWPKNRSKR